MTSSRRPLVRIPQQMRDAMVAHAAFCMPYEACGLVAFDRDGAARFVYALTNRARSAHRYLVDPTEHFRAIQHAEASGWVIGGVFHSHPDGPAVPSLTDRTEARDPSWVYFVVARGEVRAWSIAGGMVELAVQVV